MIKLLFGSALLFCMAIAGGAEVIGKYPTYICYDKNDPSMAAQANYMTRLFGKVKKRPTVVEKANYKPGFPTIFIGPGAAALVKKFSMPEDMKDQEGIIKRIGDDLVITGKDKNGIMFGISYFLSHYLDRNVFDYDSSCITRNPKWVIPDVDVRFSPGIKHRQIYSGDPLFRGGNEMSLPFFRSGSPSSNHSFANYLKGCNVPNVLAKLKNGKRDPVNPCMTSSEANAYFLNKLRNFIKYDRSKYKQIFWPNLYDISQNDGIFKPCTCKKCTEVVKKHGESLLLMRFINRIAVAIAKEYPDIYISTLAYNTTMKEPKNTNEKYNDNVMVALTIGNVSAPIALDNKNGKLLEVWSKRCRNLQVWSYLKYYDGFEYPYIKTRKTIQAEIKLFRQYNVTAFFGESENPRSRSFYSFQFYLTHKLLQEPKADVDKLTNLFFSNYYGKAAEPMLQYLTYLEKRMEKLPYSSLANNSYLDKEFFETANRFLDQAEKAVSENKTHLRHVMQERIPVDRAALNLSKRLQKEKCNLPDKTIIIERLKRSLTHSLDGYREINKNNKRIQKIIVEGHNEIEQECKLFALLPIPVPEQFAEKNVIDIHYNDFSPYGWKNYVEDPEAVCGVAMNMPKTIDLKKWKRSKLHTFPLIVGVYDNVPMPAGHLEGIHFDKKNMPPADENYHWYKIGTITVLPRSYVYLHWAWHHRIYLQKAFSYTVVPEKMEIHVHIKITGPAYVPGSKKKNDILVDRVIAVRLGKPKYDKAK